MKKYMNIDKMNNEQKALYEQGFLFDENGKIVSLNPNFFAIYVKNNYDIIYALDHNFYMYDDVGVWVKYDENELIADLCDEIIGTSRVVWHSKLEIEYMKLLKRILRTSEELNSQKYLINLKNGMYDTTRHKLIAHDPKYFSTIQIPVTYDEEAECPKYNKYLYEVFEGDEERRQKAIEWLGYCLTQETKAQKALILYGSGSNGKGVFTTILSMLVGEENLSHVPLNELHRSFSRVTLFGKSVNLSTENEMGGKSFNTQYFKAITGEDTIQAEFKGQPVFSFKPTAKMVIAMNNLPVSKDRSNGYYRRLDFLPFTRIFTKDEVDSDLVSKLTEELAGIFNLAIEGLVTLQNNNYKFSPCQVSEALLEDYKEELNPMITFVDEGIEVVEEDHREDNKIIYNAFKCWASDNGHKGYANISNQRFWREFDAEIKRRELKVITGRSNKFRYHTGIKVVDDVLSKQERRVILAKHKGIKKVKSKVSEMFEDEDADGAEVG